MPGPALCLSRHPPAGHAPGRFDARFFLADAGAIAGDLDEIFRPPGLCEEFVAPALGARWAEARKLNLPFITEVVLAEVQAMGHWARIYPPRSRFSTIRPAPVDLPADCLTPQDEKKSGQVMAGQSNREELCVITPTQEGLWRTIILLH